MNSFIMTPTGVTIFFDDLAQTHTIDDKHENFEKICKAVSIDEYDLAFELMNPKQLLDQFTYNSPRFEIKEGQVYFDGIMIHNHACTMMIDMAKKDLDITYLENFLINLYENPSNRAITELYGFLEAGKMPITPDGYFLAYKRINSEWKDIYSSTIDNSVGQVVTMPRGAVNDNSNETCSHGLHFCSYEYLKFFDVGRVVVVKINPRDVVSIPSDYNDTKGRCCKYEVLRELDGYHGDSEASEEMRIETPVIVDILLHDGIAEDYSDEDYQDEEFDFDELFASTEPENVIRCIDERNGVRYAFTTIEEASLTTGVKVKHINRALKKGKQKNSLGYKFFYLDHT